MVRGELVFATPNAFCTITNNTIREVRPPPLPPLPSLNPLPTKNKEDLHLLIRLCPVPHIENAISYNISALHVFLVLRAKVTLEVLSLQT